MTFKPEYPGTFIAYRSDPKSQEQAINRILGMDSGFNQNMYKDKIKKYKETWDISDKDITDAYQEMNSEQDGGNIKPRDIKLYNKTKKYINKKYAKHSAYRSGLLVQKYKKNFTKKYGRKKNPYIGRKTPKKGLSRWFKEKWVNQRGKIGYKYKSDIYRPSKRITKKTPITYKELTKKQIKRARTKKYKKGRVNRF